MTLLNPHHRHLIASLGAIGAASLLGPRLAFAAGAETDRRFVFIIQRGAADGLATLAPLGDPAYKGLRGALADDLAGGIKLDGMFSLHPALSGLGELYTKKQALFVHATGIPYRDRSHFDAQNVLETGGTLPYQQKDGWMNRLLGLMPAATRAMAVGPTVPAALRGAHDVTSYGNSALPDADDDLLQRVAQLYAGDTQLHALWDGAMQARTMAAGADDKKQNPAALGKLAAQLLSGPQGARVAMIETGGWDTHVNQPGRLTNQFKGLDTMIAALRQGLGSSWDRTLVLVATEFGRTAKTNGTGGTDHGTASLAMLLGGAVNGGRIVADWPGLGETQLYEGRDLKPTMPIDTVIAGAVGSHFGIDPARLMASAFPGNTGKPVEGLIKA